MEALLTFNTVRDVTIFAVVVVRGHHRRHGVCDRAALGHLWTRRQNTTPFVNADNNNFHFDKYTDVLFGMCLFENVAKCTLYMLTRVVLTDRRTQQNGLQRNVKIQLTEIVPVGMVVPNTGEWSLLVVTVT